MSTQRSDIDRPTMCGHTLFRFVRSNIFYNLIPMIISSGKHSILPCWNGHVLFTTFTGTKQISRGFGNCHQTCTRKLVAGDLVDMTAAIQNSILYQTNISDNLKTVHKGFTSFRNTYLGSYRTGKVSQPQTFMENENHEVWKNKDMGLFLSTKKGKDNKKEGRR
jgi:hypothetical protein